ncbi:MAG: CinA family protein [Lachnospiraceae bacterium]|nr:CinA family protein [Lachnospiraceae bacterium]
MRQAAQNLLDLLKQQNLHISMAESCTGGMMASTLVDLSGASDVFEEGYVTYSNRVKQKLLGVKAETLEQYTVVSSQVAEEMAEGVHNRSGADLTMAVTGYAGPDDGEDGTPAGTVYIGTWYAGDTQSRHYHFNGDRNSCRRQAVEAAYTFALERIKQSE